MAEITTAYMHGLIGRDNPTILEIGANDGTDTLEFIKEFPDACIYCFEPDPRAVDRFREQVDKPNVFLVEAAVCDLDGEGTFYSSSGRAPESSRRPGAPKCCWLDEWDLSGSLCRPTGHLSYSPWTTFPEDRQYQVKTVRLDTWSEPYRYMGVLSTVDWIWCDVQGAEHLVIAGASETLAITRYFYTEFYDKPLYQGQLPLSEIRRLLPDFDLIGTYGDNALFKNWSW